MGKLKKPLVVVLAVVVLLGLAAGGFFAYKQITKKDSKQEQAKNEEVIDDTTGYKPVAESRNTTVADQIKNGTYTYAADSGGAVIALARNQTANKQYDEALKTLSRIPDLKGEENLVIMTQFHEAKINVYKFSNNQTEYTKAKAAYLAYLNQFKTNQQALDTKKNLDKLYPNTITIVASGDVED